jgi:hypothetical protein
MNNKPLAIVSPLCLCLVAANAWADLEPFSFGASETVQHQTNLDHTDGSIATPATPAWISTTEFNAAVAQALGRDKLVANAAVDFNRYRHAKGPNATDLKGRNSTGYSAAAEVDWNTIGDLSGALGADSHRRQYVYGETADLNGTGTVPVTGRNMQTDNHAFARIALGGEARWTIFGGVDANQRNFSNELFKSNEERQWSTNAGTRYSTSPDLSFGLTGSYVRGDYPHGAVDRTQSNFNSKSLVATTKWQASGNSTLDASLGVTSESSDALSGARHFVNGSLNWNWRPESHFAFNLGLKRSSDADTSSTGASTGVINANNLNGTSINNVGHFEVTYALTAKISLDASGDYTQRRYSNLESAEGVVSGSTDTSRLYLTLRYQPTRTTELSCGGGRENRHADASLKGAAKSYNDNYAQCAGSIHFD